MNRVSFLLLSLATATQAFAAIDNRSYADLRYSLAVDGAACPEVVVWSGGEPVGAIASTAVAGASAKKQVSAVTYEPVVVEAGLPLSPALQDSLADLCAGRSTPRTLLLTSRSAAGAPTTIQAVNALLSEARFPALDATSKDAARLTLVFRVERTEPASAPVDAAAGQKTRLPALVSNFRLSLDGLPTARVALIGPFVITRGAAEKSASALRVKSIAAPAAVPAIIPDLGLEIGQADLAGWAAWRDSFLVKGDNTDVAEKSGLLELLGPDLKTPVFTLKLGNVGLVRLAQPPAETGQIARLRAELYCETMTVVAAPAKTAP